MLVHGAAGAVGTMVTQLAREFDTNVMAPAALPTVEGARLARRNSSTSGSTLWLDVGGDDLVFDVIDGDIDSGPRVWSGPGERWCPIVGRPRRGPRRLAVDFVVESDRAHWVRSCGRCGTYGCGRTSATSRPSALAAHARRAYASLSDDDRHPRRIETRRSSPLAQPRGTARQPHWAVPLGPARCQTAGRMPAVRTTRRSGPRRLKFGL